MTTMIETIRQTSLDLISALAVDNTSDYTNAVNAAADAGEFERLQVIHWYLAHYLPHAGTTNHSLSFIEELLEHLRVAQGIRNDQNLGMMLGFNGYVEMINEAHDNPGSLPLITHLISDRKLHDWKLIEPLLKEMKPVPSALAQGVL